MIPILEVFTKSYKEETDYREFMKKNISKMKVNDDDIGANQKIETLIDTNFVSNFTIKLDIC